MSDALLSASVQGRMKLDSRNWVNDPQQAGTGAAGYGQAVAAVAFGLRRATAHLTFDLDRALHHCCTRCGNAGDGVARTRAAAAGDQGGSKA